MNFVRLVEGESHFVDTTSPTAPRSQVLAELQRLKNVDVIISSGSVEAATLARLCALSGLRVVLFSKDSFGADQDLSNLRLAADLFGKILSGQLFTLRRKLKAFTNVCSNLVHYQASELSFIKSASLLQKLYLYYAKTLFSQLKPQSHGLLVPLFDLRSFLFASITAARQEGAFCIEQLRVTSMLKLPDNIIRVEWADSESDLTGSLNTGVVFDSPRRLVALSSQPIARLNYASDVKEVFAHKGSINGGSISISENGAIDLDTCNLLDLFEATRRLLNSTLKISKSNVQVGSLEGRKLPTG